MEWDPRPYRSTGIWRCVVARRERQLAYWHKKSGGYVKRRKRMLAAERAQIVARLTELEQEASSLC